MARTRTPRTAVATLAGCLVAALFAADAHAVRPGTWEDRADAPVRRNEASYVYVNGEKVYQDLDALGHYPSSHGCIRIPPKDADWLTAWNIEGVPIVVLPWRGGFTE